MSSQYHVNQRLSYQSSLCTIRYIGSVESTAGEWLGVEWDDSAKGKHDGQHGGKRYFECTSTGQKVASFIRPSRVADAEQSFVEAVRQKYAETTKGLVSTADQEIVISGKTVEEIGFNKIRDQQSKLHELRVVIVDGHGIKAAETGTQKIRDICPNILDIDLSRNFFEQFGQIVDICGQLDRLRSLRINGNRFGFDATESIVFQDKLIGIKELELDLTLLPWRTICLVAEQFKISLTSLTASSNNLRALLDPLPTPLLSSLTLEFNEFDCLSNLAALTSLESLETLRLKGNRISMIKSGSNGVQSPVFKRNLRYVDLSYNAVSDWTFVDGLLDVFPGLEALRFSNNPIYQDASTEIGPDEGYMLTLARLGNLKVLNFTNITKAERMNADMFYLSRIGKALAEVPEIDEHKVINNHRRYLELCRIYGAPLIDRRAPNMANPNILEARLIRFAFYLSSDTPASTGDERHRIQEIPRSFDVYRVKGIVGRMFNVPPLSLRLIWETGQWDPVAGYDELEREGLDEAYEKLGEVQEELAARRGRLLKREVEIEDSSRQIGFCVDGLEARVRIERR